MADTTVVNNANANLYTTIGPWGPYWIDKDIGIIVYIDSSNNLVYTRTVNGGIDWSASIISFDNVTNIACWFDQETPEDNGTLVHIAFLETSGLDTVRHVTIDISDGTEGTETGIAAITVSVTSSENRIAITKTLSGNLLVALSTQTEIECYRSIDDGVNWTSRADVFEIATDKDWLLLFPANTGDDNDACALFNDRASNQLRLKMYDDSENTWTSTFVAGKIDSDTYIEMDGAIRHSDKHLLVISHSNPPSTNNDLVAFDLTVDSIADPTITQKTNVITDQDDSIQAAIIINQSNDDVYAAYLKGGTWEDTVDVVFHKSTDGMDNWGAEQAYNETTDDLRSIHGGRTIGFDGGRIQWSWFNDDIDDILVNLVNDIEIAASLRPKDFLDNITLTDSISISRDTHTVSKSFSNNITLTDSFGTIHIKAPIPASGLSEITLTDSFDVLKIATPVRRSFSEIQVNGSVVPQVRFANVKKSTSENNNSSSFTAELNNYNGRHTTDFNIKDDIEIFVERGVNPPSIKIFNGIIEDIDFISEKEKERMILKGRDYTANLQDTVVLPEIYNNLPAGSIVKDIMNKYTEGITQTNVNDSTVTVSGITFKYTPVFDAINELAKLANFVFYVDVNKDLHFEPKSSVSTGRTFDNTNVRRSKFIEKRNTVFNEIWVRGDNYLDHFQETFQAGSPLGGSVFTLVHNPHNTEVTHESILKEGDVFGMGITASGTNYLVDFDAKKIIFTSGTDIGDSVPASGDGVVIDYERGLGILATRQDKASQLIYGKRIKAIIDTNIKEPVTADAIAQREILDGAIPKKEGTLLINDVVNLTPSQTCVVNLPFNNVNNQTYDIIEANYNLMPSRLLDGDILTIKVNKKIPDVVDKIKDINDRLKKVEVNRLGISDLLLRQESAETTLSLIGSNWFLSEGVATGSISYLYDTNFVPPISPFDTASGTTQGICAGSFTGSAISHLFTITISGGTF